MQRITCCIPVQEDIPDGNQSKALPLHTSSSHSCVAQNELGATRWNCTVKNNVKVNRLFNNDAFESLSTKCIFHFHPLFFVFNYLFIFMTWTEKESAVHKEAVKKKQKKKTAHNARRRWPKKTGKKKTLKTRKSQRFKSYDPLLFPFTRQSSKDLAEINSFMISALRLGWDSILKVRRCETCNLIENVSF